MLPGAIVDVLRSRANPLTRSSPPTRGRRKTYVRDGRSRGQGRFPDSVLAQQPRYCMNGDGAAAARGCSGTSGAERMSGSSTEEQDDWIRNKLGVNLPKRDKRNLAARPRNAAAADGAAPPATAPAPQGATPAATPAAVVPPARGFVRAQPRKAVADDDAAAPVTAPAPQAVPPAAAPAAVAPPAPKGVTFNLPVRAGDHENFVEGYIGALSKSAQIKAIPGSDAALQTAQRHSDKGEYPQALAVLNDLVKDIAYPGVEAWVLDPAQRKYRVEMLIEQYTGKLNLIRNKQNELGIPHACSTEEAGLDKCKTRAGQVSQEMSRAIQGADPDKLKALFEEWSKLERLVKFWDDKIKELWFADMEGRWNQGLDAIPPDQRLKSPAIAMANNYGRPELLELAQMAEVQALAYKAKPENKNDPVAQGDFHKKLQVWEMAAIYAYSTADYNDVAKVLRDSNPATAEEIKELNEKKKRFGAYIEAAKVGLGKLPSYPGAVVRCNKTVWPQLITDLTKTGMFTDQSFMSTGKQKVAGFGEIEMHISGIKTGKDISLFSLHQTEGEILFPPGSKFRLTEAEVTGPDGKITKFTDHSVFDQHVTTATKVAKLSFVQAG
jgi:hypothetical protein